MIISGKSLYRIVGYVLILMIVSRILLYAAGYLGVNLFSHYTIRPDYETVTAFGQSYEILKLPKTIGQTHWIGPGDLLKFDSYFYLRIADTGYDRFSFDTPHPPANWVFFPLYPLAVAAIHKLTALPLLHSGLILSQLCLWAALVFLYLIGLEKGFSHRQSRCILFLALLYPSSVYYSMAYTESLFLLLSAASIYFSLRRQYAAAFLIAGLSTVTRVPGVANLLFVGGSFLLHRGLRYTWKDLRYLVCIGVSLLPLAGYFAYTYRLTGNFLAPVQEQSNWARQQAVPFQGYLHYLTDPYFILGGGWDNGFISFTVSTFVFLVFLAALLLYGKTWLRKPEEALFFLYGLMLIAIPFSSSPVYLTSVVRYMMVSLPLYFYIQQLSEKYDLAGKTAVGFFAVFQIVITIAFFNDYFFVV